MRALVTNDDGIDAPGLAVLARIARDAGLDVVVAAPAEQSSGASAAITAARREGRTPVERVELPDLTGVPAFAVSAQPGHIVLGALRGWLDPAPDLVLSGINHGANVGRAVLPDHPDPGALRHASLAPFGTVQARVAATQDGPWEMTEVEVPDEPAPGSDSALLAAGHATLTALRPVTEDPAFRDGRPGQ